MATRELLSPAQRAQMLCIPDHHLLKCDTEEIGEFHSHPNHVSSDFGPGEILRGLEWRTLLPYCHHREHRHTCAVCRLWQLGGYLTS